LTPNPPADPTPSEDSRTQLEKQLEILDLVGTIDYYEDYDYKANRLLDRIEIDP
jgi:hypothetical protein